MDALTEYLPVFAPQLGVIIQDDDGIRLGFVAIDRLVRGQSSGGIPLTHKMSLAEVRGLADAMTRTVAFMNLPVGGAKSGIMCPAEADAEAKQRRLALFGRKIMLLLQSTLNIEFIRHP